MLDIGTVEERPGAGSFRLGQFPNNYQDDPITNAHTQNIEANWQPLKARLYTVNTRGHRNHVCEFLWRRQVKKSGARLFVTLTRDIERIE